MGQEESRPKSHDLQITVVKIKDENIAQKELKALEIAKQFQVSQMITITNLLIIIPLVLSIITGSYAIVWYLITTIDIYIWTPLVNLLYLIWDNVMPYWFVIRCSFGGYWPGHCWSLSYYYPYDFLQHCRNLAISVGHCWSLLNKFPHEFTNHCWNNFGYELYDCSHLVKLII